MNDSTLDGAVVHRMLQITRQSWAQPLPAPAAPAAVSRRQTSSRQLAVLRLARQSHRPWGLQPLARLVAGDVRA